MADCQSAGRFEWLVTSLTVLVSIPGSLPGHYIFLFLSVFQPIEGNDVVPGNRRVGAGLFRKPGRFQHHGVAAFKREAAYRATVDAAMIPEMLAIGIAIRPVTPVAQGVVGKRLPGSSLARDHGKGIAAVHLREKIDGDTIGRIPGPSHRDIYNKRLWRLSAIYGNLPHRS